MNSETHGRTVSEEAVDVALAAWGKASHAWSKLGDDRDEPCSRYAMRAVVAALDSHNIAVVETPK